MHLYDCMISYMNTNNNLDGQYRNTLIFYLNIPRDLQNIPIFQLVSTCEVQRLKTFKLLYFKDRFNHICNDTILVSMLQLTKIVPLVCYNFVVCSVNFVLHFILFSYKTVLLQLCSGITFIQAHNLRYHHVIQPYAYAIL